LALDEAFSGFPVALLLPYGEISSHSIQLNP
jgi:hypothetical protein